MYVINFLLSLMNAFQEPASFVAVSMLVPKEHYARAGGLQGFSGAAVSILAPALGALLMASGGLNLVLIVDLATFFAGNIIQSLTSRPWLWCAAALGSYLMAAVMNVNLDLLMRERVPTEMQGRVFSAKSTLQNFTIPPALLLGGLQADTVFEPFMGTDSAIQRMLSGFFGTDLTSCVEPDLKSSPQWITDARLEAVFCRMDTAQRVW